MSAYRSTAYLGLAAGLALSIPASADGYCVACYGPDAVYRCVIEGARAGLPADPRHQMACIRQIATEGHHQRCSVERFSTENCDGQLRVIAAGGLAVPPVGAPPVPAAEATGPPDMAPMDPAENQLTGKSGEPAETLPAPAKAGQPDAPPRTVEEMAKKSGEATKKGLSDMSEAVSKTTEKAGDQIEGAGNAVAGAAKKTWDCVVSLFNDC